MSWQLIALLVSGLTCFAVTAFGFAKDLYQERRARRRTELRSRWPRPVPIVKDREHPLHVRGGACGDVRRAG